MKTLRYTLRLLDDVIVSARAATVGAHESLDHLPGSVFLGAAAASFYGAWKSQTQGVPVSWAWTAFHSGQVRFGNAFPLTPSGQSTRPVPLSLHHAKGVSVAGAESLHNAALQPWNAEEQGQPQQAREGWISSANKWVKTSHRNRLKTAIDPDNFDRAKDSSLFGFSSLPADSLWSGFIEADDDIPSELWKAIRERFASGQSLRLGRSRNTEYGRATIEAVNENTGDGFASGSGRADVVVVHALADLALIDANGQPTLVPDPAQFGLPGCALCPEHCFIRTRTYSPFNLFRNAHDLERQVIAKGSVLTFKASPGGPPPNPGTVWVGAYRQDGLGLVAVNPDYLLKEKVQLTKPKEKTGECRDVPAPAAMPELPFAKAMKRRFEDRQIQIIALELAQSWAEDWSKAKGISTSQWARIREAAAHAETRAALLAELEQKDKNGKPLEDVGIFHHGRMAKKWRDNSRAQSPAGRVLKSLESLKDMRALLADGGFEKPDRAVDRLALAACREAAVLTARKIQGSKHD